MVFKGSRSLNSSMTPLLLNSKKPDFLYHISLRDIKRTRSILKNGLTCNEEGQIFLFENKSIGKEGCTVINTIADCIASEQIGIKSYTMFEVNTAGINAELIPDQVSEYTAKFQWYILQDKIDPKYIIPFGNFRTKFRPFFNFKAIGSR